jgi:hypothetical protein
MLITLAVAGGGAAEDSPVLARYSLFCTTCT